MSLCFVRLRPVSWFYTGKSVLDPARGRTSFFRQLKWHDLEHRMMAPHFTQPAFNIPLKIDMTDLGNVFFSHAWNPWQCLLTNVLTRDTYKALDVLVKTTENSFAVHNLHAGAPPFSPDLWQNYARDRVKKRRNPYGWQSTSRCTSWTWVTAGLYGTLAASAKWSKQWVQDLCCKVASKALPLAWKERWNAVLFL